MILQHALGTIPRDPWRLPLRRNGGAVLLGSLLAGLLVSAFVVALLLQQAPRYESRALLVIDQPNATRSLASESIVVKLHQLREKYVVLGRTRSIVQPVAERVNLPPEVVSASLLLEAPRPSLVIIIRARTDSPGTARAIADETAYELVGFISREQEAAAVPPGKRIELSVAVPARSSEQVEPTRGRVATLGSIGGVFAGTVFYGAMSIRARKKTAV